MKIYVGSTNSLLETDNEEILKALIHIYTVEYPGSYFIKKTHANWDGKKRFVTPKGVFKTGLLPRIIANLEKVDIKPTIEYHSNISNVEYHDDLLEKYTLFEDQVDLLQRLIIAGRGICNAPTGSGKSIIMAAMIALWNSLGKNNILIVTSRKQLVSQLYTFFDSCLPNVGVCYGEGFVPGKTMVASIGSIERIVDDTYKPDLVLVDEIHEFSGGKTSLAKIEEIDCYHKFGFTATVPKDLFSRLTVEGTFGSVIVGSTTQELTMKGRIPVAKINIYNCKHEEFGSEDSYLETYQKKVINNRERNALICSMVDSIISTNRNAKILLLVKNISHIDNLVKLLPDAVVIQGSDDIQSRYDKIKIFLEKKNVIIGTTVMQTGINIPELTDFINARALKSEIATIQAIGRMLRGSNTVTIHDIKDDCKYLKKHFKERLAAYEKEGHTINEVTI